jgi:hypothetical protein
LHKERLGRQTSGVRNDQCRPFGANTTRALLEAAQKELAAFERKENEFRKKLRKERAAELRLPSAKNDAVN